MTGQWCAPYAGFPGGFAQWGRSMAELGQKLADGTDVITTATPGYLMKKGLDATALDLFLGDCSGVIGGTSAILVILGGLYLVWKKTANHRIVVSGFVAFALVQTLAWRLGGQPADRHLLLRDGPHLGLLDQ
jgi:Na+-transporting NADH:ubiquinone oxidoreductase subunit B